MEGRMLSHDTVIAHEASPAILAAIGITPLRSQPLTRPGFIDRELILSVSDGFSRQTWVREGQVRRETQDTLCLDPHEQVRITISNDMPGVRIISVGDGRLLRIPSGASASIDVTTPLQGGFTIRVVGEPAVSRPIDVQTRRRASARAA
jgi:hypothetical protein